MKLAQGRFLVKAASDCSIALVSKPEMIVLLRSQESWPPSRWTLPLPASVPQPQRSVLIVEDDDDSAFVLARQLRHYGWTAAITSKPADALELAQQKDFDCLVVDIGLADGMDGVELGMALRRLPDNEALPIVIHTGWQNQVGRARLAQFDAYLLKPVSITALMNVVQVVIDRSSKRRATDLGRAVPGVLPVSGVSGITDKNLLREYRT